MNEIMIRFLNKAKRSGNFYLNGIKIADKQKTAKTGGFYYVKELQEI